MEEIIRTLLAGVAAAVMACVPSAAPQTETAEAVPAKAYVLVSTATQYGWLPLAEEGEAYDYTLTQVDEAGHEYINVIHVTDSGVWMASSTCEGQDCVEQGEVTLENRDSRLLMNYILCLPNQVTLALYTPEEILAMMQP